MKRFLLMYIFETNLRDSFLKKLFKLTALSFSVHIAVYRLFFFCECFWWILFSDEWENASSIFWYDGTGFGSFGFICPHFWQRYLGKIHSSDPIWLGDSRTVKNINFASFRKMKRKPRSLYVSARVLVRSLTSILGHFECLFVRYHTCSIRFCMGFFYKTF